MTDQINAQPIRTQVATPTPREALAGASYVDRVVGGRVFTMAGSETMSTAPHVSLEHSGMVLSGPTALLTAAHLHARHPGMVFLIEPMSGKTMASKERPLILEMQDSLFPPTVEEMLQRQRVAGAVAAVIPAGFVDLGDAEALKAVLGAAQRVERDDAILPIFAHQKWMGPDHIGQLIAVAKRSEHRVALALGAKQGDPLAMKGGVEGYRARSLLRRGFRSAPQRPGGRGRYSTLLVSGVSQFQIHVDAVSRSGSSSAVITVGVTDR